MDKNTREKSDMPDFEIYEYVARNKKGPEGPQFKSTHT